jgi:TolA-binding protein
LTKRLTIESGGIVKNEDDKKPLRIGFIFLEKGQGYRIAQKNIPILTGYDTRDIKNLPLSVTFIQDLNSDKWIVTDGRIAFFSGKPHLLQGHRVKIIGKEKDAISIGNTSYPPGNYLVKSNQLTDVTLPEAIADSTDTDANESPPQSEIMQTVEKPSSPAKVKKTDETRQKKTDQTVIKPKEPEEPARPETVADVKTSEPLPDSKPKTETVSSPEKPKTDVSMTQTSDKTTEPKDTPVSLKKTEKKKGRAKQTPSTPPQKKYVLPPLAPEARQAIENGWSLSDHGKQKEAIAEFIRVFQYHSNDPRAYFGMGIAYGEMGKYQKGLEHIDRAIKKIPESGRYYYGRGRINLMAGNRQEAIRDFETAANLGHETAKKFLDRLR